MDCVTWKEFCASPQEQLDFGSFWSTVMLFPGFHVKVKELHWKISRWSLYIQQWIPPPVDTTSGGFLRTFTFHWHPVRGGHPKKYYNMHSELFSSQVEWWWNFIHFNLWTYIEGKSWTKTSSTSTFDHSMRHELLLNSWYKKGETGEASERVSSIVEIVTQVMKEKRKAGHSKICTDVFEMYYNTPLYGKISISTRTCMRLDDWILYTFVCLCFVCHHNRETYRL